MSRSPFVRVLLTGALLTAAAPAGFLDPLPVRGQAAFAGEWAMRNHLGPTAVRLATDPTDDVVPGFATWFVRTLDRAVEEELAAGASPGAALVVGHRGSVVLARSWGRVDWNPSAPPATPETLYDLASVTKVAATTVAAMVLVEEGRLDLDAPLSTYLPEWPSQGQRGAVTPRHLMAHTSGLPAGAAVWRVGPERSDVLELLAGVRLTDAPGREETYSDLGPILMAYVVEAVAGEPLDRFLARRVYGPLGMGNTTFRPRTTGIPPDYIAPTERIGQELLHGVVHDPSARALGGVAGNAGLFSSAMDLAILASALLWESPDRIVCRDVLKDFTRADGPGRFGTGWETPPGWSFWSEAFSPLAFGHTGFTGTSLWIDPERDMFVVLLMNRVNPTSANRRHQDLRRAVHDVIQRAHLEGEATARARDWRSVDVWLGGDSCRAARGLEIFREMGTGIAAGYPVLRVP